MFAPSSSPGNKARLSLFRAIKRAPGRWSVETAPFGRIRGWSGRRDGGASLSRVRGVEPRVTVPSRLCTELEAGHGLTSEFEEMGWVSSLACDAEGVPCDGGGLRVNRD